MAPAYCISSWTGLASACCPKGEGTRVGVGGYRRRGVDSHLTGGILTGPVPAQEASLALCRLARHTDPDAFVRAGFLENRGLEQETPDNHPSAFGSANRMRKVDPRNAFWV